MKRLTLLLTALLPIHAPHAATHGPAEKQYTLKQSDVLSVREGRFYLDSQPFAEISFQTIRFFALPWGPSGAESYADPKKRELLYEALDKALALLDWRACLAANQPMDVTALTEKVAADIEIARTWKPGTLKDDKKRSGTEKGFNK